MPAEISTGTTRETAQLTMKTSAAPRCSNGVSVPPSSPWLSGSPSAVGVEPAAVYGLQVVVPSSSVVVAVVGEEELVGCAVSVAAGVT